MKRATRQESMFTKTSEDLPLFSGTCPTAPAPCFEPAPAAQQQRLTPDPVGGWQHETQSEYTITREESTK